MNITPIAIAHTPFKQKFGIPRQPSLITSATAQIIFTREYSSPDAVRGLEAFSHIWLQFGFHEHTDVGFKPLVRPPRLGGNEKTGVFATRSSFRPNALGLSLVALKDIVITDKQVKLVVACPDLLDGTPIYDIKPYIEYTDHVRDSRCGFAPSAPTTRLGVIISTTVEESLVQHYNEKEQREIKQLIIDLLTQDPRPAYRSGKPDNRNYSMKLYDFDLHWNVQDNRVMVYGIDFGATGQEH